MGQLRIYVASGGQILMLPIDLTQAAGQAYAQAQQQNRLSAWDTILAEVIISRLATVREPTYEQRQRIYSGVGRWATERANDHELHLEPQPQPQRQPHMPPLWQAPPAPAPTGGSTMSADPIAQLQQALVAARQEQEALANQLNTCDRARAETMRQCAAAQGETSTLRTALAQEQGVNALLRNERDAARAELGRVRQAETMWQQEQQTRVAAQQQVAALNGQLHEARRQIEQLSARLGEIQRANALPSDGLVPPQPSQPGTRRAGTAEGSMKSTLATELITRVERLVRDFATLDQRWHNLNSAAALEGRYAHAAQDTMQANAQVLALHRALLGGAEPGDAEARLTALEERYNRLSMTARALFRQRTSCEEKPVWK